MTFASKITITRLLMVPVFAWLAVGYAQSVSSGQPNETLRWAALGVFITASAGDALDGWVARYFNQRSKFGAFIDPIADKSLLLTGVLTLTLVDWDKDGWRLPLWFAAIVVLRDVIILGGINVLYFKHRPVLIAPHWSGKICTASQMLALVWVMLKITPITPFWPCLLSAVFIAWSTVAYIRQGLRILRAPLGP
ncbi:MAG: putative CDP-diacylglycerol--glycerol-3-phosphate 3-phosphatidyl-transferase 2 [Verrucomicrobiota bacterium]